MDFKKFMQSRATKITLAVICELIVVLIAFRAGMFVGFSKAGFSFGWSEHYHQNFGGPRHGFFNKFDGDDFIQAYGAAGPIVKIDGTTLVVKGKDNAEKQILTTPTTSVLRGREAIALSELKVDDQIVVIGSPNANGQIEAKVVRLTPSNPPMPMPGFPPMMR